VAVVIAAAAAAASVVVVVVAAAVVIAVVAVVSAAVVVVAVAELSGEFPGLSAGTGPSSSCWGALTLPRVDMRGYAAGACRR